MPTLSSGLSGPRALRLRVLGPPPPECDVVRCPLLTGTWTELLTHWATKCSVRNCRNPTLIGFSRYLSKYLPTYLLASLKPHTLTPLWTHSQPAIYSSVKTNPLTPSSDCPLKNRSPPPPTSVYLQSKSSFLCAPTALLPCCVWVHALVPTSPDSEIPGVCEQKSCVLFICLFRAKFRSRTLDSIPLINACRINENTEKWHIKVVTVANERTTYDVYVKGCWWLSHCGHFLGNQKVIVTTWEHVMTIKSNMGRASGPKENGLFVKI